MLNSKLVYSQGNFRTRKNSGSLTLKVSIQEVYEGGMAKYTN